MWGEIQMAGASSWNNQPPGLVSQLHKHSFQQLLNGPIKNKTHTPPKKKNPRRFSVLRLKPRRKAWRRQSPAKQSPAGKEEERQWPGDCVVGVGGPSWWLLLSCGTQIQTEKMRRQSQTCSGSGFWDPQHHSTLHLEGTSRVRYT